MRRNDTRSTASSGRYTPVLRVTLLIAATLSVAALASAQSNPARSFSSEFEQPYGFGPDADSQPIDVGTRDASGNRLIVDGRIIPGGDLSSLPGGLLNGGAGFSGAGSSTAIGNQLNVITQGSWNTVIITNNQTNYGDINANASVLNGELDLND
jgi:holdfast attachment protein HfaA